MSEPTCPYAKSNMTPCVLRDGDICYAVSPAGNPICVGCERSPASLGREPPKDWDKTLREDQARHRRR